MTSYLKKLTAVPPALFSLFVFAAAPALHAQEAAAPGIFADGQEYYGDDEEYHIYGSVENDQYTSSTGFFRVTIPVLPELGGQINDTPNTVTFQDDYGEHATIGCFRMNDELRAEETKRGRKEFLVWFFQQFIQRDFTRNVPGTSTEPNARFINGTQGGTLFTQLLLPNGSAFAHRVFVFPPKSGHVAKRGNFIFINNGNIYVISIELAERIFEHSTYNKTVTEEEAVLRRRLNDLLNRITFMEGPANAPAPAGNIPATGIAPAPAPAATPSEIPAITLPSSGPSSSGTSLK
ncbi:hypothetical protein M2447_000133 [Ereboglobus sp. PH5-10]|uniref:hypothetical protein n=1 Tax=Ereboglobus sp. PH5-10 TaxID=2940629 RepID=UPI002406CACF|nr:hypothetical protein [Ereboglobus sp. PH5-10]MDF9826057.1 hypothetical protein [Ereboglobus sp. PH5-10]